ncbi:phosphatase PAP2 family protein [Streptomyces sp. NBC_01190]|uniref:phosphatase PAP2 family protein n=1 Tax=Streptomyces sp. NBC_01190 TaxID=2903767 RepID=UPI0038662098|nr:phosphatase PAP2 family protein [Streptomyces sp. NBC_01190]
MAEVANDSVNPDISLLRAINDIAGRVPHGVNRVAEILGEYGLLVLIGMVSCWCWWRVARRSPDAPEAVAGVLWALAAGGLALLLNIPVRELVQRPRPSVDYDGLEVLGSAGHHYAFVSDGAALAAAVAVGLFMVSRRLGAAALAIAFLQGLSDLYLGVHYPTDVFGGFALGAATALLLAPLGLALLTALTRFVARTRLSFLVRRTGAGPVPSEGTPLPRQRADDKGLAA